MSSRMNNFKYSDLKIGGWQKTGLIDFPGLVSTLVFFQGCDMNCFYCHNRKLIAFEKNKCGYISPQEIIDYLHKRKTLIDGVVLSGGEPLVQNINQLKNFCYSLKDMGLKIKLDTNGQHPERLREFIGLVDYFAIDLKGIASMYIEELNGSLDLTIKSIGIVDSATSNYEVRTTVCPGMKYQDIEFLAKIKFNFPLWRLNVYNTPVLPDELDYKIRMNILNKCNREVLSKNELSSCIKCLSIYQNNIVIG